jgi:hypothetical protein
MRLTSPTVTPEAWAFTDLDGRIESASRAMSSVLGVGRLRRGDDLLQLFPLPRKALQHDIDAARRGWPVSRDLSIGALGLPERKVRYRVNRRLEMAGEGLFWMVDELSGPCAAAAA